MDEEYENYNHMVTKADLELSNENTKRMNEQVQALNKAAKAIEEADKRSNPEFAYHQPKNEKIKVDHQKIRNRCNDLAITIKETVPDCDEREIALTKLREVMMWANAGIAIHGS